MNHTKLRKTLGRSVLKALASICLILPAAFLTERPASANVDQVATFYGQIGTGGVKVGGAAGTATQPFYSTATAVMDIYYNGSATAAYVSLFASSMTFYAPFGTVDTSIGGGSSYGAGSFDIAPSTATAGAICDLINAQAPTVGTNGSANGGPPTASSYHCTLTGAIRSDVLNNILPTNVIETANINALSAVGGYNIPISTTQIMSLGIIPAAGRHVVLDYCTVSSAGTPVVQVWGSLARNGVGASGFDMLGNPTTDATMVWQSPALVANTATNEPLGTPVAFPWLEFGQGGVNYSFKNAPTGNLYNGHVVVRVNAYGSGYANETSSNYVACFWNEK